MTADPRRPVMNHVGLCVTDVDRSRRFYEAVLGFTLRNELQPDDGSTARLLQVEAPVNATAVYLTLGDFVLELLHFDREGNPSARRRVFTEPGLTHLSFSVDDLEATGALVRQHGGEVLADTELAGVAVMVRDPDGQFIELLARGVV